MKHTIPISSEQSEFKQAHIRGQIATVIDELVEAGVFGRRAKATHAKTSRALFPALSETYSTGIAVGYVVGSKEGFDAGKWDGGREAEVRFAHVKEGLARIRLKIEQMRALVTVVTVDLGNLEEILTPTRKFFGVLLVKAGARLMRGMVTVNPPHHPKGYPPLVRPVPPMPAIPPPPPPAPGSNWNR